MSLLDGFLKVDYFKRYLMNKGFIKSMLYYGTLSLPHTPQMYAIISLHDHILFIMFMILTFVSYLLITTLTEFKYFPHTINDPIWNDADSSESYIDISSDNLIDNTNLNNLNAIMFLKVMFIKEYRYLLTWIKTQSWDKLFNVKNVNKDLAFDRILESVWSKSMYSWSTLAHCTMIEIYWTILPCVLLIFIAIPSFWLLYIFDEILDPSITFKIIGHQWYWSYEMSDFNDISMHWAWLKISQHPKIQHDSYLLDVADLSLGDLRLLKTTLPLILPKDLHIRLLITSDDVLHSFSVPAFGIKLDAVPGRLNQISTFIKDYGIFFGQCSELCGANHGFMPIEIFVLPLKQYYWFLYNTVISINEWWFMMPC